VANISINTTQLQQVLTEALMNEWSLQGHAMTSKVVHDIDFVVKQEAQLLSLSGYMYPYGNIQASGARWRKFPNWYAIQQWVKLRMQIQDEQKSKSIAFAIAQTFKKSGMPTAGSLQFSSTGKRTDWVEEAFKRDETKIEDTIRQMIFGLLTVNIDVLIKKWNLILNEK